jgi:hypothetical protein
MRSIKTLGLAAVMALVLVACVGATTASATTISPANTAFTASSTNSSLAISGGATWACTGSTISGTTPAAGAATTKSTPISLSYTNCTFFFLAATVTVPANCKAGGANPVVLNTMWSSASDIAQTVTIPSGCAITISIPGIGCTLTFAGPQTIGNGSSGAGGIGWTNGTGSVFSFATMNNAFIPSINSSGGGVGCPTAGAHTGTLTGRYTVTNPTTAPAVTIGS